MPSAVRGAGAVYNGEQMRCGGIRCPLPKIFWGESVVHGDMSICDGVKMILWKYESKQSTDSKWGLQKSREGFSKVTVCSAVIHIIDLEGEALITFSWRGGRCLLLFCVGLTRLLIVLNKMQGLSWFAEMYLWKVLARSLAHFTSFTIYYNFVINPFVIDGALLLCLTHFSFFLLSCIRFKGRDITVYPRSTAIKGFKDFHPVSGWGWGGGGGIGARYKLQKANVRFFYVSKSGAVYVRRSLLR